MNNRSNITMHADIIRSSTLQADLNTKVFIANYMDFTTPVLANYAHNNKCCTIS